MDLWEMIQSMLASGYAEPVILAILGVLGFRNKEQILAIISSLLNPDKVPTPQPGPQPGPLPLPAPDDDDRPRRYVIVDAHHLLYTIAAEEGHTECQRKLDEILAHLLTGKGSAHVDAA